MKEDGGEEYYVQDLVDEVLRTQEPDVKWLYEINLQNFLDGIDPESIDVRVYANETFFGAFSGFTAHHRYTLEFREDRHLIGKIEVVIGLLFDLQGKEFDKLGVEMDESFLTDEFLNALPLSALYHYSWPLVREIVPPLVATMNWPAVVFPLQYKHEVGPHSWFYGPDIINRIISF